MRKENIHTDQESKVDRTDVEERIPAEYRHLWVPYTSDKVLFHLTTADGLAGIKELGYIEPRDPVPRNWAGMRAIFMADSEDPIYEQSLPNVLAHARKKGDHLIRLHVKTKNKLYRSTDPERTFQIMSLEPLELNDIVEIEDLG